MTTTCTPIRLSPSVKFFGQGFDESYVTHELTDPQKARLLTKGRPDIYQLQDKNNPEKRAGILLRMTEDSTNIPEIRANFEESEAKIRFVKDTTQDTAIKEAPIEMITIKAGTVFMQDDSGAFFRLHDAFDLPGMDAVLPYLRNPLWRPCFIPGLNDTFELTWSRDKEGKKYDSVTLVSGAQTLVGQLDDSTEARCSLAAINRSAQFYFFNDPMDKSIIRVGRQMSYPHEKITDCHYWLVQEALGCLQNAGISDYLHSRLKDPHTQIDSSSNLSFSTEYMKEICSFNQGVDIWCLNAGSQTDLLPDQPILVRTKDQGWFIGTLELGFVYLPDFFADFVRDYSNEIKNNTRIFKMRGLEPLIVEFPDPDDTYKIRVRYAERSFDPEYVTIAEKKAWVLGSRFRRFVYARFEEKYSDYRSVYSRKLTTNSDLRKWPFSL